MRIPIPFVLYMMVLMLPGQVPAQEPVKPGGGNAEVTPASHGGHAGHGQRSPKTWQLPDMVDARVTLWRPDLQSETVALDDGRVAIPRTGLASYHALVAEDTSQGRTRVAIRYDYGHGKPVSSSPEDLLDQPKATLELVPSPIPREHYRYISGETWGFTLRYQDGVAADVDVLLRTSQGSQLTASTDINGRAWFTLPEDFKDVKPGRRLNDPGSFRVQAALEREGHQYETRLEAVYHPNPAHWRSTTLGFWVMGGGFLAGLAIVRGFGRNREESA